MSSNRLQLLSGGQDAGALGFLSRKDLCSAGQQAAFLLSAPSGSVLCAELPILGVASFPGQPASRDQVQQAALLHSFSAGWPRLYQAWLTALSPLCPIPLSPPVFSPRTSCIPNCLSVNFQRTQSTTYICLMCLLSCSYHESQENAHVDPASWVTTILKSKLLRV